MDNFGKISFLAHFEAKTGDSSKTFGQQTYGSTERRPTNIGCDRYAKKCISDDKLLRTTAIHIRA